MQLQLTPRALTAMLLGGFAIGTQFVALAALLAEVSDVVTQREFLADILAKHADKLDADDLQALRNMGVPIKAVHKLTP
jgi:hypothetical protein